MTLPVDMSVRTPHKHRQLRPPLPALWFSYSGPFLPGNLLCSASAVLTVGLACLPQIVLLLGHGSSNETRAGMVA